MAAVSSVLVQIHSVKLQLTLLLFKEECQIKQMAVLTLMSLRVFTVKLKNNENVNLDFYLKKILNLTPNKALKKAYQEKKIKVNNLIANKKTIIKNGDEIKIHSNNIFLKNEFKIKPNFTKRIKILYENENWIAVHKPSKMHAFPQKPSEDNTVLNYLVAQKPQVKECMNLEKPLEGSLVHRLDYGTSGVLIFAKNKKAFTEIKKSWNLNNSYKIYLAWVHGEIKESFKIKAKIEHNPKNKKKMIIVPIKIENEANAITEIKPLTSTLNSFAQKITLVLIRIHTGLMHQIRVSLASLGHPLLLDDLYINTKKINLKFIFLDSKLHLDTLKIFYEIEKELKPLIEKKDKNLFSCLDKNFLIKRETFFLHSYAIYNNQIKLKISNEINFQNFVRSNYFFV
jgi:23S rRNA pseudouridine1911/1915/1917 synthase